MDFDWNVIAVHPRIGSGLVIELAMFLIAGLIVRRCIRDDLSERSTRESRPRLHFFGGFLRTPTEAAGTSGDSVGRWPRISFLARAVLFTTAIEVVMSHRASAIYLDALPSRGSAARTRPPFAPPAQQAITRDFAFFVPPELAADALVRAIRSSDKARITAARLFDRYEAADGELSLAFEVTLQPAEKSFTDEEIAELSARIVAAAEKLGARLRG